ncbi:lamin tail domain-containing protein [bacterium]|nr:lamin tail domain-containing protein [bacterium]
MKNKSKLVFYLILNVLVSAATTLTVLLIWQATHPQPEIVDIPAAPSTGQIDDSASTEEIPAPTLDLLQQDYQVSIRTVVGAGNLDMEYVEVINQSSGAVDLTGWQLINPDEVRFDFPALILNEGGAVEVHSKTGQNTVIELFWQADTPLWASGDTVTLQDADGTVQATYSIP